MTYVHAHHMSTINCLGSAYSDSNTSEAHCDINGLEGYNILYTFCYIWYEEKWDLLIYHHL